MEGDDKQFVALPPSAMVAHLLAIGQTARARELATERIHANPDDPASYISLARVLIALRERDAAVQAATRAVELAPEWDAAWSIHASALFVRGRFADAERSMLEAIRLWPDDPDLFRQYARLLSQCGRPADALAFVQRALELDPGDDAAHRMLAALLDRVHPSQWRLSEDAARRAVALDPEDDDGFAILGALLLAQGRTTEAEQALRTALELNPMNRLAVDALAQALMARNPFYRPFLWYALRMRRLGPGVQLLVVASIWAIVSALLATVAREGALSSLVTCGYLALCAYTWFADPITRAMLRRHYSWM
jgi:tetratricopeptide (TPR) repeat protein